MPKPTLIVLTIFLAIASATIVAQEPILHFERIHTRIVGEASNRLSIKVFADGTTIASIPPYMKRAGRHEFALSTPQMNDVTAMVDALAGISQDSLDEERARAMSGNSAGIVHDVSDPDTVTFTVPRDDRSQHTLVAQSPDLMRDTQRSESPMGQLAEMEQQLRAFVQNATEGRP